MSVASVQRVQWAAAASRSGARPVARSAGRRVVVRSQQQEGVAAAASFTRLEEALDDYRRAPPSVVRAPWLALFVWWHFS